MALRAGFPNWRQCLEKDGSRAREMKLTPSKKNVGWALNCRRCLSYVEFLSLALKIQNREMLISSSFFLSVFALCFPIFKNGLKLGGTVFIVLPGLSRLCVKGLKILSSESGGGGQLSLIIFLHRFFRYLVKTAGGATTLVGDVI